MTGSAAGREPGGRRRDDAAIVLASVALLLFQIALTRILSVVVWYHFAFLTLSLAMMGLSVPGVWFSLARDPQRFLRPLLLVAGAALPLSTAALTAYGAPLHERSVLFVIAAMLPGLTALGGVLCLLLMRAPGPAVARRYGLDLLGAALGAAVAIPLLDLVPTPRLAAACGLLPLAALLFYPGRARLAGGALAAAVTVSLLVPGLYEIRRSKAYDETKTSPLYEKWTSLARLTVFDESFFFLRGHERGFTWGRGRIEPEGPPVRQYWLEQDGSAGTPVTAFHGDLEAVSFLLGDVTTVGGQLRPPHRVAVIGAGGGRDILAALATGAGDIDAVELNPAIIRLVSGKFGTFSGDVYHAPGVRAVASEGRSFLTREGPPYDLIQISLTDSWAASAAGAYALAENNLYTVEAMGLYLRRVTGDGLVSLSRWTQELPWLIAVSREALARAGVAEPERHVALVSAGRLSTLLISPRPFDAADRARLVEIALERNFSIVYPRRGIRLLPGSFLADAVERGLGPLAEAGLDVSPATDDRPYFFQVVSPFSEVNDQARRIREITGLSVQVEPVHALRQAMGAVIALAVMVLLVLPFARLGRGRFGALAGLGRGTLYFSAIGAGFMLLESTWIQRFTLYLGHPSYAMTVVIASLLVGSGLGALGSARLGLDRLRRGGLLVAVILGLVSLALPAMFAATAQNPLALRIALSLGILGATGAGLGLFFPLGMIRFGEEGKPWFWAVNGFLGVTASVLSLGLSMEFGFRGLGAAGALLYAVAWLALLGPGPRAADGSATPARS